MEHQTFNNKRIIWESRTSQILVVIGCFVFVAAAIFIHTQISILVFWVTVVFFGGGGLLTLRQLLNPNNLFVAPSPAFTQQKQAEQVRQKQENLGVFAYSVSGFSFTQILGTTYHDWTDIASIFGYKAAILGLET